MSVTFGTDGIRGVANAQLRPEIALALGRAAARHLGETRFLVGRDTRQSGPMLAAALSAGIASEGFDVIDVGVIPTPGLAWLGAKYNLPVAMVSASHNPFGDNGIKLFGPGGAKLHTDVERAIERDVNALLDGDEISVLAVPVGREVGAISVDLDLAHEYVADLAASVPPPFARRPRIVCDCANGAASALAAELFSLLGLETIFIANTPDGTNINDHCGATATHLLTQTVVREKADIGVSFDGDADRLIACDADGNVVDGDVLLALFAFDLDDRSLLEHKSVVVTVMSNLGLRRALSDRDITVIETSVGDRNVTDAMELHDISLGGEQSGHIVFRRDALIGDGMYTALRLIEVYSRSRKSLSELAREAMTRLPQITHNVVVHDPNLLESRPKIFATAQSLEAELGDWGRVFVRASGTEPRVRIMVEGEDVLQVKKVVDEMTDVVEREMAVE